jgi:hypothetical protein
MIRGRIASSTVTVSWELLDTKTRRPSGEATTFHGSEPVRRPPSDLPLNLLRSALEIAMTLTVPAAAFAV